jgi:hypothetical protein
MYYLFENIQYGGVWPRRAFAPSPRRPEIFMNPDPPRWALSQELEAKQTLLDSSAPWPPSGNSLTGVARWDEFAPLKTAWADNQPTNRKVLDKSGRWADMPFLMLAKCAEAQAIRKGWPEDLSNTFVGKDIEQATLILNPAQAAAEGATRERLERIGGHGALIIDWLDAAPLDAVPLGQLADRIVAFLRERREDHQALISWRERNRHANSAARNAW